MEISREETVLQATKIIELINELEAENCECGPTLSKHTQDIIDWADCGGLTDIWVLAYDTARRYRSGRVSVPDFILILESIQSMASKALIEGGAR